jgi:hypothetical protein
MRLTVRHSSAPEFKCGDKVHVHSAAVGVVVEHVRRRDPKRITLLEPNTTFVNTNATETTLEFRGWVTDYVQYVQRHLILQ